MMSEGERPSENSSEPLRESDTSAERRFFNVNTPLEDIVDQVWADCEKQKKS